MCLTAKLFLQTHVTFCECLVFHEFRRNLHKYLEQEGIADLPFQFACVIFLHAYTQGGTERLL